MSFQMARRALLVTLPAPQTAVTTPDTVLTWDMDPSLLSESSIGVSVPATLSVKPQMEVWAASVANVAPCAGRSFRLPLPMGMAFSAQ